MARHISDETKEFYPDYLIEILIVIIITLGSVFVVAMLFEPELGREINFTSSYQPMPEWYFLWLYQLIRFFPGTFAFMGSVAVPCAAGVLLLCVPLLDNGTVSSARKTTVSISILFFSIVILTLLPVLQ